MGKIRNLDSKTNQDWQEKLKAKRLELSNLSSPLRDRVETGEFESINEALIKVHYKVNGHKEFASVGKWNRKGYKIKKGEKGFMVWSRPVSVMEQEKAEQEGKEASGADEERRMFRIAYVFSNKQVEPFENNKKRATA